LKLENAVSAVGRLFYQSPIYFDFRMGLFIDQSQSMALKMQKRDSSTSTPLNDAFLASAIVKML
jgi:hypothetical protein